MKSVRKRRVRMAVSFWMVLVVMTFWFGSFCSAASQADVAKVIKTKSCEGCDLARANLAGQDLAGARLARANLGEANLRGAHLTGADLSGAQLGDAVLSDADLTEANLTRTILTGAYMINTNLTGATWTDGTVCKAGSVGKCEK